MADGTMMTGQGDTETAEGSQGQGEAAQADPNAAPQSGEQAQGAPKGDEGKPAGETEGVEKAEGEKGKEGEGKPDVPEKYEFEKPEGFEGELDAKAIEEFEPIAKELGLSQEQANKMMALHAESIQRANEQARDNWAQQMETWQNDLRNDPEFGGQNFDGNVKAAMKAVESFGTPGLREALESTGMGNHPELVRTFAAIGKAISEDKFVQGNQSQGQRSAADIMYPQQK